MYAVERRSRILDIVRGQGRLEVATISDELDVTPETVRRDLTALERRGLLRRVHGGAVPVERLGLEPALDDRTGRHVAEKDRIARAALALVPEEGTVLLDAGTTTGRLVDLLPLDRDLTVVTGSVPVAHRVTTRGDGLSLLTLGGVIRPRTGAAVGDQVTRALADLRVDVAFLGTNGVTVADGLTTPDPAEAAVKRAMVASSRRAVLLTDSTKFGHVHLCRFAALEALDTVVTDDGLDDDTAAAVADSGPEVVRA